MKIKVNLKNIKKIREKEFEFESGNLYLIKGSNNYGKSTFLQAMKIGLTGEKRGTDIVSHGESEGILKFEIIAANGQKYLVKVEIDDNDKTVFTIMDSKAQILKSTSRNNIIASIFKYNAFTVNEWFAWGLTAEGRRKQADIILNLLPEKAKTEYLFIDEQINEKTGLLYLQRKDVNKNLNAQKSIVDKNKLTDEEKKSIEQKEGASKLIKELEDKKEKLSIALSQNEENTKKLNDCNIFIMSFDDNKTQFLNENKEKEEEIVNDIKHLKDELKKKEETLIKQQEVSKTLLANAEKDLIDTKKEKERLNKLVDPKTKEEYDSVVIRIDKGKKFIESLSNLIAKENIVNDAEKELFDLKLSSDDYTQKIEDFKLRRITIITENKLPVDNIIIENGECFYIDSKGNKLPFVEDSVSYSEGGMIVLNLIMEVNKELPICLIGHASEYDPSRFDTMIALAEKHNAIILCDQVIQENDHELEIEIFQKKDKNKEFKKDSNNDLTLF